MNCIAYLAPEIPALSATFVYNEILALREKGWEVVPFSVHLPTVAVSEERVSDLKDAVHYLYIESISRFLFAAASLLQTRPRAFFRTLRMAFRDALGIGLCTRIGVGLLYRFLVACRVGNILRHKKCQHIHAHFAHVPTDIAMYASLLTGISFSFTAHANDLFERRWLLAEKIERAKFVITVSEYNRDFLVNIGGHREKMSIVRCGVDTKRFAYEFSKSIFPPFKIGSIGRMVEKKGFDTLLHAAASLNDNKINFRLIIAGDGPLRNELRTTANRLGLADLVDFSGPIANAQVPNWLHSLDLFVLSCQQDANGDMDGIPVVLMEAMASGVPVVSTHISGVPELIAHEHEGLLVNSRSAESLAVAITQLLFNSELRASFSMNGLSKVKAEFDADVNISRLIKILSNYVPSNGKMAR